MSNFYGLIKTVFALQMTHKVTKPIKQAKNFIIDTNHSKSDNVTRRLYKKKLFRKLGRQEVNGQEYV